MKTEERMRLVLSRVNGRPSSIQDGKMNTYSVLSGRPPGASENTKVDMPLLRWTGGVASSRLGGLEGETTDARRASELGRWSPIS